MNAYFANLLKYEEVVVGIFFLKLLFVRVKCALSKCILEKYLKINKRAKRSFLHPHEKDSFSVFSVASSSF
jgi:hypothetical protein